MWNSGANDIVKALTAAAIRGHLSVVKRLQNLGAYDIRVVGYAAGMGHVEVVKFLLKGRVARRSDDVNQALALAALYGQIDVIELLDNLQYSYNHKLGFFMAACGGYLAIMKRMYINANISLEDLDKAVSLNMHRYVRGVVSWLIHKGATRPKYESNLYELVDRLKIVFTNLVDPVDPVDQPI